MEGRLAEDDRIRARHNRLQRGAARIFLALVLVGLVRMAFGIVRMRSLGGIRLMSVRIVRVLLAGGFRFMQIFMAGVRDRLLVV